MGKSRSYTIVEDDLTDMTCYLEKWKLPPGYDLESESSGTLSKNKWDRSCVPYYYPSRLGAIEEEECEPFESHLSAFILPREISVRESSAESPSLSAPRLNRDQHSHHRSGTLHSNAILKKAKDQGTGARYSASKSNSFTLAATSLAGVGPPTHFSSH